MLNQRKYHREHVEEKKPDLEMEKKLASLRDIRQRKCDKLESELRQCKNSFAQAKQELQQAIAGIDRAKQKFLTDRAQLQKKMLGLAMTPALLTSWMKSEEVLAEGITDAKALADKKQQKVWQCEKILEQADKRYRESALSIEKLDILKEEMDKEKAEDD